MKDLFVPYPIATKLKELKYDEPCLAMYIITTKGGEPEFRYNYAEHGLWFRHNSDGKAKTWNDPNCKCSAPSYQQCIDWLRTKHKISIENHYDWVTNNEWQCVAQGLDGTFYADTLEFSKDYYEALEKCIVETLKIIQDGKTN